MRLPRPKDSEALALAALFKRPESLSKHFPFDEYLPNERLFVNRDGSFGVVFRVELAEHEAMNEVAVVGAVQSLKAWFSLPENAVMQVIFEQMPVSPLDGRFDAWANQYPNAHAVSKMLFEKRLEVIRG